MREKEKERNRKRGWEGDRKSDRNRVSRNTNPSVGPSSVLLVLSIRSSWWWRSPAKKRRVQAINISWARWECPSTSPEGGQVWHCLLQDSGSVASLHIMCSALVQGLRNESRECFGGFWWIMTPPQLSLMWMSCGCGFPSVGDFTTEPVCVMEGGCSLPLTRGHVVRPKFSSSPLVWRGVCANLAADKPVGYGLHPKASWGWFSGQLLGLALLWMHPSSLALSISSQTWDDWKTGLLLSYLRFF